MAATPPQIDYLSKDFASFRRLMLDRLSALVPDWNERNPADTGQAIVELLAYLGDHLSYYQDAVGNEAYLSTARRRISARRHARLLDYNMHDGCNARAFVALSVDVRANGQVLPKGIQLLTRALEQPTVLPRTQLDPLCSAGSQVFETLHSLQLRARHSMMRFFSAASDAVLPTGSTSASLDNNAISGASITLQRGDLLLLEEIAGPDTADSADADPSHRHAVRLTAADPGVDTATGRPIVRISWAAADALPFDLRLSASAARGNVVLCDHGCTRPQLAALGTPQALIDETGRYYPTLNDGPLTQQGAFPQGGSFVTHDPLAPASAVFSYAMRDVQPAIALTDAEGNAWAPRRDLLASSRFASDFVVEIEDSVTYLRFGNGVFGKAPVAALFASYRVGNGRAGNVGAEAIAHLVDWLTPSGGDASWLSGILEIRNPLPAQGGQDPESIEHARLLAPQAFRGQERAVTLDDYGTIARLHPQVRDAQATRRWAGSYYSIILTVQRQGRQPLSAAFCAELRAFIDRYRMIGDDLQITTPASVPLDLQLTIHVAAESFRRVVCDQVARALGSTGVDAASGGLFAPDSYSLGQPIYLSHVVSAVMQVPGVDWVEVDRFARYGGPSDKEAGVIVLNRLEIPLLDNDASAAARGLLNLTAVGGV